jgi:CDP-4-dehydro-6-deoxyglucose reductase
MPRLLSLSRAARLVGTTRGKLQKQVQDGEISSFEGKVRLSDLHTLYPQARIEDTAMLDRVEEIIERARFKARNRALLPTDKQSLLARAAMLGDELALAKLDLSNYSFFIHKLRSRLNKLKDTADPDTKEILHNLINWVEAEIPLAAQHTPNQNALLVQDTMLRLITAQIHIQPSGHEYLLEGNNTVLEAGLSAGFALDYGCSNGNCGKCKAKLISGQVKKTRAHDYSFSEAEKLQNCFLMCSNTALTDLVIEAVEAGNSRDIPLQSIHAKLRKLDSASDDVAILNLKTPRTKRLRFLAGQQARIIINDTLNAQLPIASCPCDDLNIQFHIPVNKDKAFYQYLTQELKTNDDIQLEGPSGEFILDDDAANPIVFLAQNTGFAPIKSLVEHALTLAHAEAIFLYWFVSEGNTHYLRNQCRAWDDAFDSLHYSEETLPGKEHSTTFSNALTTALTDMATQHPELGNSHVYIAGEQHFVEQCREFFSGLSVSRLMSETLE